jgi:hypothetical protein
MYGNNLYDIPLRPIGKDNGSYVNWVGRGGGLVLILVTSELMFLCSQMPADNWFLNAEPNFFLLSN